MGHLPSKVSSAPYNVVNWIIAVWSVYVVAGGVLNLLTKLLGRLSAALARLMHF